MIRRASAPRALAAAVLVAAFASSCGAPADTAWLRFLGFRESGAATNLSQLTGNLRDGKTDGVDAELQNPSVAVGKTGGGTGVLVYRARVQYRMTGLAPPPADYPLTLYLPPAAAVQEGSAEPTTGTLSGLPLAPVTLKNWLLDTRLFEDATLTPTVELFAVVTFFAVTDEGEELETTGSLAISLANSP